MVCEKPEPYEGRTDVITNPLLIVEVLSPSTRNYDQGPKFQYYKTLPSFKEYVMIEQTLPWVFVFYKSAENTWVDSEAADTGSSIYLKSIDCTINLARIYKHIAF